MAIINTFCDKLNKAGSKKAVALHDSVIEVFYEALMECSFCTIYDYRK